jgi:zinc transporter, ZIP family
VPTFIGTAVGHAWTNEWVEVAFLAVAAGSILYVVIELLAVLRRVDAKVLVTWALLLGLFLGFGTELIIEAAGG